MDGLWSKVDVFFCYSMYLQTLLFITRTLKKNLIFFKIHTIDYIHQQDNMSTQIQKSASHCHQKEKRNTFMIMKNRDRP